MVTQDAQARVNALRQRLAESSTRADALFTTMAQLPDRESSVGFSFVNSVNDSAPTELAAANKAKLQAILDSLSEKKTAAQLPEPQLADTGAMSPSPNGLPSQGGLRAKLSQLT